MRRSSTIRLGSPLATEILQGIHGDKARQFLEAEIQKATSKTTDLFQKIRLYDEICSNEELLRQILERASTNE